ncbi:hypothetical protein A8709_21960 [Paenibacillus pectinilyticus]|uniref:Regulator of SigK n=1 Tax=Paenibacillus pectinilyticus TaxID=512399 RepID=A0A1C0ZY94_9BACL|nr:anti-sigma factor [Paenibacillus pectinilyticus]OCT12990.1 hypothetical protein A8709_21960 [Paenibacillus pectinilyticus]
MSDNRNHQCELAELYALGALEIDEMEKYEAHLKTCQDCQELVSEYQRVTDLLPLASERAELPTGMKSRVLTRVLMSDAQVQGDNMTVMASERIEERYVERGAGRNVVSQRTTQLKDRVPDADTQKKTSTNVTRGSRAWRYLSLGLAVAVIALISYTSQLQQDIDRLEQKVAISTEPAQGFKVNQAVALSPGAKDIVAKGLATIVVDSKGTHLVVQAENLPALKGTEAYQVWLIKGEAKYNAGTFVSQDGNGALYYSFQPQEYDTVAITLEPDAQGETPRGQIVLAAPIKNG